MISFSLFIFAVWVLAPTMGMLFTVYFSHNVPLLGHQKTFFTKCLAFIEEAQRRFDYGTKPFFCGI